MRLARLFFAALILLSQPPAWADRGQDGQRSPSEAGEMAGRQTGGRVLAVKPADGGYQVKVLTPDGQVRYVFIPGR